MQRSQGQVGRVHSDGAAPTSATPGHLSHLLWAAWGGGQGKPVLAGGLCIEQSQAANSRRGLQLLVFSRIGQRLATPVQRQDPLPSQACPGEKLINFPRGSISVCP